MFLWRNKENIKSFFFNEKAPMITNLKTDHLIVTAQLILIKAPDKRGKYISYFSSKTYVVGTHYKCLKGVLLMSTHNICLHREIREYECHIRNYGVYCVYLLRCSYACTSANSSSR